MRSWPQGHSPCDDAVDSSPRIREGIVISLKECVRSFFPRRAKYFLIAVFYLVGHLAATTTLIFAQRAPGSSPTADTDGGELTLGRPVEATLNVAESRSYAIRVEAGQFVHAVVEQKGIHVVESLVNSAGTELARTESLSGAYGTQPISVVAARDEVLRLIITPFGTQAEGTYELLLTDLRLPTKADRVRINAERTYMEGQQLFNRGDAASARSKWVESRNLWQMLDDKYQEGLSLYGLGRACASLGEKQQAVDYYNQALPLERAVGDRRGEVTTLNNIAKVYDDLGEKQQALDYYNQVLPIQRAVGEPFGEATTLNNIARVHADLGEKQQAVDYYNQALPLERTVGDRRGEATTLNNIGVFYSDLGEKQKALDCYNQALPLERAVGDRRGEAATLDNIGGVYARLGEEQQALDYYNQALPIHRGAGDRRGEATTLNNIGEVHARLGEEQQALDYYNQALPIHRAVGDRRGEATTLNNIGGVYARLGEEQQALDYYNQALPIHRAVGDRAGEAATLNNIGGVYDLGGEPQKALDYATESLLLFRMVRDSLGEGYSLMGLMHVEKASHNLPLAILFGKQAVDRFQQVRRNIRGLEQEVQQSFLQSKEHDYRELAGLLISQGRLPEAQQILDLLKIEEYSEFSHHRGGNHSANEPVTYNEAEKKAKYQEDQISGDITKVGQDWAALNAKRIALSAEENTRYAELSAEMQDARRRMRQYLADLSANFKKLDTLDDVAGANSKLRGYQGETSDLQGMLRKLDPGTVAIYTVVLPDRLSLIVITPQTMFSHDVMISSLDLRNKVAAFRQLFVDSPPPEEEVKTKGQALYQVLFEPAVQKALEGVNAKTLMWSLDDVLRYVPMAALFDGRQYLVERYRNVLITPNRSHLLEEPQLAGVTGVAMGVSTQYDPADNLPALSSVPEELSAVVHSEQVVGSHGPIAGSIMLNDSFTQTNMEDALSRQPRVVHIASHYVYEPGGDTTSFLLLGGKDKGGRGFHLTLADLRDDPKIDFDGVELVTFSGCETAQGANNGDGHEVDGLGMVGIEDKHAKAVIATLWKVSDTSTSQLMAEFYKQWVTTAKTTKAEALRRAQVAVLHDATSQYTAPHYANPYYWAPFVLIGNWR
jgi:CHAT domain-containing protein/tetratricopeptide (TPR) repeat protein